MIPILYESNETAFVSNGLCRLRDAISCIVTEERNGIYECEFEYPVDGANFDLIRCGRIICVRHDDSSDVQPFDIVSCSKPISGVVTFRAVHVSYRQSALTVYGTGINSLADAFDLLTTAQPSNPFTYSADFTSTAYMAAADGIPRSVRQMLGGIEGSILDTFGGEYEFDRFNVILHKNRGQARDFAIRYGVNMLEYKDDTDYEGTFTSVVPYWKGNDNGSDIVVIGDRVDSGMAGYNGRNDCIPLDMSDKFEDKPSKAQLTSAAFSYMHANQTSLPSQTINVDFVRLQDIGYENLNTLLECKLCDTVNVLFNKYDMQGSFKIVKTVYDVLAERYDGMELGALSTSLSKALGITQSAESLNRIDDLAVEDLSVAGDVSIVGTLTIGGQPVNAHVIEEGGTGTNTNWHYRKWSDGTLECWIRKEYSSVNITSSFGQMRYASLSAVPNYPVNFLYYPVVSITGTVTSGNGWVAGNNTNYSVTNVGGLVAYAPTNQSGVSVTVNIYAIGKWR